jgi:hypothetical protein
MASNWSVAEVKAWLESIMLDYIAADFEERFVSGHVVMRQVLVFCAFGNHASLL